jgi:hypothetical protein
VFRALEERPELVWPMRRDPSGLTGPTPGETRGPNWRRTSWNCYVPVGVEQTVEQRIVEAAALLPAYGGVAGWASLRWHRARWFEGFAADGGMLPVTLVTAGDDIRGQPGIKVSAERLDPRDLIVVDGVRVTTSVRSVFFEMRNARDLRAGARVLSMAAYSDEVSVDELARYALEHPGWTGVPRCRDAIPYAEENCWSPTEVAMVLVWRLDAGLPRPLCNCPVFNRRGEHVGTPDLLDPEAGVVGEYEGGVHLTSARRAKDVRREELFRRMGLEYFTVVNADLCDPAGLAERMHTVRSRAKWLAESRRSWSINPPPWWVPTGTVAQRRALTPEQRRRLLRYRAA